MELVGQEKLFDFGLGYIRVALVIDVGDALISCN